MRAQTLSGKSNGGTTGGISQPPSVGTRTQQGLVPGVYLGTQEKLGRIEREM